MKWFWHEFEIQDFSDLVELLKISILMMLRNFWNAFYNYLFYGGCFQLQSPIHLTTKAALY